MASELSQIAASLDVLSQAFRTHLGPQSGASSLNIPHPQLSAIRRGAYTVTNPVERRTFDPATVTLGQLAQVVGTIITDLQAIKVLG
jgi:hypothetical protein